jgi:hypothetical protein
MWLVTTMGQRWVGMSSLLIRVASVKHYYNLTGICANCMQDISTINTHNYNLAKGAVVHLSTSGK